MINRVDLLQRGVDLTTGDRNNTYGDFYTNMRRMAELVEILVGVTLTPAECCRVMLAAKLARELVSPLGTHAHPDNCVDGMVYWAAAYECDAVSQLQPKEQAND